MPLWCTDTDTKIHDIKRFGRPDQWQAGIVEDETTRMFVLFDPVADVELWAPTEARLAVGWINFLERHARPRENMRPKTRHAVLVRDGFACKFCGANRESGARLAVDHILPVTLAGGDDLDNLRTLCETCNLGRAGNPLLEFVPAEAQVRNEDRPALRARLKEARRAIAVEE